MWGGWAAASAMEDLHEGFPELDVEGRVDDGVHSAVDVAQPREGAVQDRRNVAVTVNVQDVCDEEGQPADDEHAWGEGGGQAGREARGRLSWDGSHAVGTWAVCRRPWPRPWAVCSHLD